MQVSRLQDILGGFVERHPSLVIGLGRMESKWLGYALDNVVIERPIYITGLARAGTTILLELLSSHKDVAFHRYRDFPMVHIPYWWNWFIERASSKNHEAVERAHKDRIRISPESPEAMEEMIWMTFFENLHNPSVSQVLDSSTSNPEFEGFYTDHIRKILLSRKGNRYLCKGNYNISRLSYIGRIFPDALFLICVRNPIGHIASLMKQHRLFCDAESQDPKVLSYMQRSGHFEFGLDRRPMNLGDKDKIDRIMDLWRSGDEVRGWAVYWASVYHFVAELFEKDKALADRMLIVHYDDFCAKPAETLRITHKHCGLEVYEDLIRAQATRISKPSYYTPDFSDADIEIILEETTPVLGRLRALSQQSSTEGIHT